MPEAVQNELPHTGDAKSPAVLLLQARWLDVAAPRSAGQTQPSSGFPKDSQRSSRTVRTFTVMGMTRLAAFVLPCVTRSVPLRPLHHVMDSHTSPITLLWAHAGINQDWLQ